MPSLPSHRCRRPLLCIILFIWTKSGVCEPALRGFIREELAHDQQQWPEWKEGNASSASSKNLESGTITAMDGNISSRETLRTSIRNFTTAYEPAEDHQPDGTMDATTDAIVRELQQTSVQAFINNYQSGTRFEDPGATGITGPTTHLPQVAHSPVTGGTGGVVFGGGAQSGTPGIAGGTFPTLGMFGRKSRYVGSLFLDPPCPKQPLYVHPYRQRVRGIYRWHWSWRFSDRLGYHGGNDWRSPCGRGARRTLVSYICVSQIYSLFLLMLKGHSV